MFAEMPLDNRTVGRIHAPGRSNRLCWDFLTVWNVIAVETI
jgi:hypothetical protein